MDATSSVSKGVFVFKNRFKSKNVGKGEPKFPHESQLWYQSYKDLLLKIEKKIDKLNKEMFGKILHDLLRYIEGCFTSTLEEIPTAVLLMGINMPDHLFQVQVLKDEIQHSITPHVAIVNAKECNSVKSFVENMIFQFVNEGYSEYTDDPDAKVIKKSLCSFSYLKSWYQNIHEDEEENANTRSLVVIIPEFESFNEEVIQDFIMIASSHMKNLPFVIIFGVATSVAVIHKTFPYHVSSKLNMEVFAAQKSIDYLNNVLEKVIFTDDCFFKLAGKPFSLLMDIFLFYDLSVKGFLQHFKYLMLEHFSSGSETAICTKEQNAEQILENFDHEDYENVRKLMSFRKFVEDSDFATRIKLIEDDTFFAKHLKMQLHKFRIYMRDFPIFLKCLLVLVSDLPKAPLGKQYRELYAIAMTENIVNTKEYQSCIQLLKFLSKDEFLSKLNTINITLEECEMSEAVKKFSYILSNIISNLESASCKPNENMLDKLILSENMSRSGLKAELMKLQSSAKQLNNYEKYREKALIEITTFFKEHLEVPTSKPFHEIFIFNNIKAVKKHVIGQFRGAVHVALNNPHCYLKCSCCKLPSEGSILPTFPDICIVYKLHLECGKLINMYDLLQSFLTIVDPESEEEMSEKEIDPKIQARFTQAIAELEFLGFVKSSKRKVDHIQRLTWGAC